MAPRGSRLLLSLLLLAAGATVDAANVRDHAHKPVMAPVTTTTTNNAVVNGETQEPAPLVVNTATIAPDVYHSIGANDKTVQELLEKFVAIYKAELLQTALNATVLQVLHAQKTDVRTEQQQSELDTGDGTAIEFVQDADSQGYQMHLLMEYHFESSMMESKRPYVSVIRLSMDCSNTTTSTGESMTACDILEHSDMPRVNESARAVPAYIQREIFNSAPASFVKNHTLNVIYDAVESQQLDFVDATPEDAMKYVRYRVHGGSSQDCMVVVLHAKGINTLLYSDGVCYDIDTSTAGFLSAQAMSAYKFSKENWPSVMLMSCLAAALVALFFTVRHRRQRSGYSYLHSKVGKLSHVPAVGSTSESTAMAS